MPSTTKPWLSSCACFLATLLFVLASGSGTARAEDSRSTIAPKVLIDFASPEAVKQVAPTKGVPASIITVDKAGISMGFPVQPAPHSGVYVTPASGKSWDLSAYGRVEAKVTNLGAKTLPFVMQVEDGANMNQPLAVRCWTSSAAWRPVWPGCDGPANFGRSSGWFRACTTAPIRVIATRWITTAGGFSVVGPRVDGPTQEPSTQQHFQILGRQVAQDRTVG